MTYTFEPKKSTYNTDVRLPIITPEYFKTLTGLDINILLANEPLDAQQRLTKLSIDAKVFLFKLKTTEARRVLLHKFKYDREWRDAFLEYVAFYVDLELNGEISDEKIKNYIEGSLLSKYRFSYQEELEAIEDV